MIDPTGGDPGMMVEGSWPRITINEPIGSTQLVGGHMLPEETTSTGYSVLRARRLPPHTAKAPSSTIPTRRSPLADSFFPINLQNLRIQVLNAYSLVYVCCCWTD